MPVNSFPARLVQNATLKPFTHAPLLFGNVVVTGPARAGKPRLK